MAWVCTACPYSTCSWCCNEFDDLDEAIEHLRKCHHWDIRRPHAIGESDSHGHCWYCFSCCTNWKDHRSYSSSQGMRQHLNSCHGGGVTKKDTHNMETHGYCENCHMYLEISCGISSADGGRVVVLFGLVVSFIKLAILLPFLFQHHYNNCCC